MKKHIYIYEKALTFALAFAMIVGFWSGMTLDVRAEKKEVDKIEITVPQPVGGQALPSLSAVTYTVTGAKATKILWCEGNSMDGKPYVGENVNAKYNTEYTMRIQYEAEDGYIFGYNTTATVNGAESPFLISGFSQDDTKGSVTYTFPPTGAEQTQTISNIAITAKEPVGGQKLPYFPDVTYETTEVKGTGIDWYEGADASGTNVAANETKYNTVYTMKVRYEAKAGYIFESDTTASVNGKPEKCELSTDKKVCYVTYTFSETEAKQTQMINSVNITIDPPEAGKTLATTCNVSTNVSPAGVDVTKVEWVMAGKEVAGPARYNTMYQVKVYLQLQDGYQYGAVQANINSIEARPDPTYSYFYCDFPATDSEPSSEDYKIIEGNNSNYVPGSGKPLRFCGNGNVDNFDHVEVDEKTVEGSNYDVEKGSTIIIFKTEYLEKLSKGKHSIKMFWKEDGGVKSAEGSFYIGEKGGEIVPGNTGTTQPANDSNDSESKPRHICSFEWVITVDPTTGADGLEEYKCTGCGAVSESHPIPASVAVVKDFYGKVKEAPEKGSITYDTGKLYTISDYILKKMAERNDVAVTVKFEYQNKKFQLTFPAGLDYSAVLTDKETMYGYFGVAAKLGLKVTEQ